MRGELSKSPAQWGCGSFGASRWWPAELQQKAGEAEGRAVQLSSPLRAHHPSRAYNLGSPGLAAPISGSAIDDSPGTLGQGKHSRRRRRRFPRLLSALDTASVARYPNLQGTP